MNSSKSHLSRKQFRGILILLSLLLCIIYLPRIYFYLHPSHDAITASELKAFKIISKNYAIKKAYHFSQQNKLKWKAPPCKFNPNSYTIKDWMYIGFSEKQAKSILNYNRFGFRSNEDLKKLFVMNEDVFSLIKDSTFFPNNVANQKVDFKPKSIDLNLASETELMSLDGIGIFFAKQIIKYREKLGGYYKIEQLLEVWKMTDETYLKIKDNFVINFSSINKMNVNQVSIEDLAKHPYFRWNLANSIVKFRMQHGDFKNLEDIKHSKLIDDEKYDQIVNYLSVK